MHREMYGVSTVQIAGRNLEISSGGVTWSEWLTVAHRARAPYPRMAEGVG
jgi:hypothetical protein